MAVAAVFQGFGGAAIAAGGGYSVGWAIAGGGCAVAVDVALIFHCFCLCLPGGRFLFLTAQRDKKRSTGRQSRTRAVRVGRPEWWAWQVPNTHSRLARGQRLSERTPRGPLYGPPPLRTEVGPSRASAPHRICFCCCTLENQGRRSGRDSPVEILYRSTIFSFLFSGVWSGNFSL